MWGQEVARRPYNTSLTVSPWGVIGEGTPYDDGGTAVTHILYNVSRKVTIYFGVDMPP